ncbi:MAG: YifB family Mg chelatase-like AAA ATPase [Pseudomonadota bacterium]
MASSEISSRAQAGLHAPRVTVETQLPGGLPSFTLVGMPETAVREARDRVKSAIQACGFEFPRGRVLVNLAPAELAKEGSRYDLAIAASILCATGQLPYRIARGFEYLGELSLAGELRPAVGALCAALAGEAPIILAPNDAAEALRLGRRHSYGLAHLSQLKQLLQHPNDPSRWGGADQDRPSSARESGRASEAPGELQAGAKPAEGWHRIIGQETAKRALAIAAAGGHHLLLVGAPGAGKSLLARSLIDLLPQPTLDEQREIAAVYSASGVDRPKGQRPFREPHHSASAVAMIGGGRRGTAGEVSLAHRGVLFLDELPHFAPSVLDLLREPLSTGQVDIARANYRVRYPARFQLIAAMNACPSGFQCRPEHCRCTPTRVRAYQSRVSGPLLDRIDLQLDVPPVSPRELLSQPSQQDQPAGAEPSTLAILRRSIESAQLRQRERQGMLNAEQHAETTLAGLAGPARNLLEKIATHNRLSARVQHRLLQVARTIADLDGTEHVAEHHIGEAIALRQLDWEGGLGVRAL